MPCRVHGVCTSWPGLGCEELAKLALRLVKFLRPAALLICRGKPGGEAPCHSRDRLHSPAQGNGAVLRFRSPAQEVAKKLKGHLRLAFLNSSPHVCRVACMTQYEADSFVVQAEGTVQDSRQNRHFHIGRYNGNVGIV